jgi:hypothetical protein
MALPVEEVSGFSVQVSAHMEVSVFSGYFYFA